MNKKLVDLIYLDSRKLESDLKADYQARIDTWLDWMNLKLDKISTEEIYIEEQSEYFIINNLLRNFLAKRFEWIQESVSNPELRYKYLLALPPFNQQGNIKSFLLHFFQLRDMPKQSTLEFSFLNHQEREIRVLWDVYKLIKTLQSTEVLKKAADDNRFSSMFSRDHISSLLNTLMDVLNLLIKICIRPEYLQQILQDFPSTCFDPEAILNRTAEDCFLVNDAVLRNFDYRNYIFHIFFKSGMKAIYQGENLTFKYNYLDYEIIRQEFLIDWLDQRLADNPRKRNVYDQYMIGEKTLSQLVKENPEIELTILKQLPKHVFDDLIADVNEAVEEENKVSIDPMSEGIGEFAKQLVRFEKSKELVQKAVHAIRKIVSDLKNKPTEADDEMEVSTNSQQLDDSPEIEFKVKRLKKSEIDFPFFCFDNYRFSKKLISLKTKMAEEFTVFSSKVQQFVTSAADHNLIKRRTPRHEWVMPFLIREIHDKKLVSTQLLILGVEAKHKQLGIGYGVGVDESFDLNAYFVYGSQEQQGAMGGKSETRMIRGEPFNIYSEANPMVVSKALQLTEIVMSDQS